MNEKKFLIIFTIVLTITAGILLTSAYKPGSHTLFKSINVSTQPTEAAEFCVRCHPDRVTSINTSVHRNAGCICHGYNPNLTEAYNINVAHNLTKDVYCTNCHSNYNITTGDIVIHSGVSGINQSAHYIISSGNKDDVYQRAKQFFGS